LLGNDSICIETKVSPQRETFASLRNETGVYDFHAPSYWWGGFVLQFCP